MLRFQLWVLEKDLQLAFGNKDGEVETFTAIKLLYLPTFKASNEYAINLTFSSFYTSSTSETVT